MKIIHILNTGSYSGAENVVITIIKKMQKDDDIIYVSKDGSIRDYLEQNNIKFEPIKKVTIKEIRRVIKKHNPDIIHAHDFTASIICAVTCGKKKLISHLHNNSLWIKKINIYSILYLLSTIKYSKILMVSESIIKEYIFRKKIYHKVKVIGNPINIEKIIEKSKVETTEKYDIVFLGRLSQAKDPIKFIEIVNRLSRQIKLKAAIIGDGPLKEQCNEIIKNYKLNNVISMKGFIENPYKILKNSKVLCMTSRWEGYGLVAIEALALGKPVIATNVGGIPDIVKDNCGKTTNNEEEMEEEIKLLLENSNYYKEKSLKAIKRAQEINNIDEYIYELKKIYKQCIREGE